MSGSPGRVMVWMKGGRYDGAAIMHHKAFSRLHPSRLQFLAGLVFLLAGGLAAVGTGRAAPQGVTIAVTGDINTPDVRVVSDVILAHPAVSAVLLAGDTFNGNPTPVEGYRALYRGTYDRFLAKIFPCPGNHDRYSTPMFSAYSEFWGKKAHAPNLYYSFDLAGWHFVSLDSYNFIDGGARADAQRDWLVRDLATKPGVPTIVYWHHPLFSNAKHLGQPKTKPFWDAIYAHGPALVFNGHNHVYERFAPMNPDGKKVAETQGIQEFVVGPGGAKPVDSETENTKGPRSEKFHGATQHVGFFTLYADGGFAYKIQSITGKGAIQVVDQGGGHFRGGRAPTAD